MYNNTLSNVTYFPLSFWYAEFGSMFYQEVVDLSMLATGIVGILLNILTLVILRSKAFSLKLYVYFNIYVINSILICFWTGTRLLNTKQLFEFSNTYRAVWYETFFSTPLLTLSYIFSGFIETIMSFERVVVLSNKFKWFEKMKPIIPCSISVAISISVCIPYFFYYKPSQMKIPLNETTVFTIHYTAPSKNLITLKQYIDITTYIIDITPIITQIVLSSISTVFMRLYVKKKKKMLSKKEPIELTNSHLSVKNQTSQITAQKVENKTIKKTRTMEIKLAMLVVILTLFSIL
jgi:hypothetical protein